MEKPTGGMLDRVLHRKAVRRWSDIAAHAQDYDLESLRDVRFKARELRGRLDKLLYRADERLALPLVGSNAIQKPLHTDWAWRPQLWRGPLFPAGMSSVESRASLGDEVTIFHDCARTELTLRQIRNQRESDLAPYGLRLDVFRFDGSFLSLVVELPPSAVQGLQLRHLVRLAAVVEMERPLEIYARLNVKHGPNTEQIVRELPLHEDEVAVDFDLAYTNLNEKRVERMWLDLIFEGAEMNQIILRDIAMTRRPRAEM